MAFKPVQRNTRAARDTEPKMGLYSGGIASLTKSALALIGDPEYVTIWVDPEERKMAFRGESSNEEIGGVKPYRVSYQNSRGAISARSALNEIGLDDKARGSFDATYNADEDWVEVDLNTSDTEGHWA